MSNPLRHVGQTPHPEVAKEVDQRCEQAQGPPQRPQQARQGQPATAASSAPPATRLPQHPSQDRAGTAPSPEQPRTAPPDEPRAQDSVLPKPTDAD